MKHKNISEASSEATAAVLKGLKVWEVSIKNNYFDGKYAATSTRLYPVLAKSAEEAKQVVLQNADAILKDLLSKKFRSGKRILPKKSAIPITDKEIVKIVDGTTNTRRSTGGFISMFSSEGQVSVKLKHGNIADYQTNEGWGAAGQKRQQDEMRKEKEQYANKIKSENPDALGNYTAWTTNGLRGSAAYQKAMAGSIHPSLKESKKQKSAVDKIRKPTAPPTKAHADKNKYNRKQKHKTGVDVDEACNKKKKSTKESKIMKFKDMIKLVIESGGQQRIDPIDEALFTWASRVAATKVESQKQEIYAGLLYERMGGTFKLHDVLAENK